MSKDEEGRVAIKEFRCLKEEGYTQYQIYGKAKERGFKNFECLHILMVVFDIELHEAREIGHKYLYDHKENKN